MSETIDLENGLPPRDTPLKQRLGLAADILFYLFCIGFFAYLFRYYLTGAGGPSLLAVTMVPVTLCVAILNDLRKQRLYPGLGAALPWAFALLYIVFSLYASYYLTTEFDNIRICRIAMWNTLHMILGGVIATLILNYTPDEYYVLFVIIQ